MGGMEVRRCSCQERLEEGDRWWVSEGKGGGARLRGEEERGRVGVKRSMERRKGAADGNQDGEGERGRWA